MAVNKEKEGWREKKMEKKEKKETKDSKDMAIINILAAQTRILLRKVARVEAKLVEKGRKDGPRAFVLTPEAASFVPSASLCEEPLDSITGDDTKSNDKAMVATCGPSLRCNSPGSCSSGEWNSTVLVKELASSVASLSLEIAPVGFGKVLGDDSVARLSAKNSRVGSKSGDKEQNTKSGRGYYHEERRFVAYCRISLPEQGCGFSDIGGGPGDCEDYASKEDWWMDLAEDLLNDFPE